MVSPPRKFNEAWVSLGEFVCRGRQPEWPLWCVPSKTAICPQQFESCRRNHTPLASSQRPEHEACRTKNLLSRGVLVRVRPGAPVRALTESRFVEAHTAAIMSRGPLRAGIEAQAGFRIRREGSGPILSPG